MNDYRYERLSESNFKELGGLIQSIYAVNVDPHQLRKKYATDGFGASFIGYFAYYKNCDSAVAYYGILPIQVQMGGMIRLAAQAADAMTHPDHRNKGLFVELARRAHELGQSLGIQFIFAFPNKNSYHGFINKLGWTHAYDMLSINFFVPTIPYSALIMKYPTLQALHSKILIGLLKKIFDFPQQLPENLIKRSRDYAGVLHDANFLEYKIGYNRILIKHKSVYLLLKVEHNNLGIGAVFNYANSSDLQGALRRLKFVCALLGIVRIRTYCSPEERLKGPFKKYGFPKKSLPYCYINFNATESLHHLQFTYLDYDNF